MVILGYNGKFRPGLANPLLHALFIVINHIIEPQATSNNAKQYCSQLWTMWAAQHALLHPVLVSLQQVAHFWLCTPSAFPVCKKTGPHTENAFQQKNRTHLFIVRRRLLQHLINENFSVAKNNITRPVQISHQIGNITTLEEAYFSRCPFDRISKR